MHNNHKNKVLRMSTYLSILCISLLTASGYAIAPALPAISRQFSRIPVSVINSLGTIQEGVVFVGVFLSVPIYKKIGMKHTILLGMGCLILSAIPPYFSNSFGILVASRVLMGLGIGLFNSLAVSIINLYYQNYKKLRLNLLGIRTAFESFGHFLTNFVAGFLLIINWHATFLVYIIAIPIFLAIVHYVPDIRHVARRAQADHDTKQKRQNQPSIKDMIRPNFHFSRKTTVLSSIFLTAILFVIVMCNTAITIEVPCLVENLHIGNGTFASWIISANTIGAGIMSFFFEPIVHFIHHYTLALGVLFTMIGCLFMFLGRSTFPITLGAIFCGIAYPVTGTYAYALTGELIPKKTETLVISITLGGCDVSAVSCPFVISWFGRATRDLIGGNYISDAFFMLGVIATVTMILIVIYTFYKNTKNAQLVKEA